jgi:hypothetical protein
MGIALAVALGQAAGGNYAGRMRRDGADTDIAVLLQD